MRSMKWHRYAAALVLALSPVLPASAQFAGGGSGIGASITTQNSFAKGQAVTPVALTDAATITVDASTSNNFTVTLGGNRTLANPTNLLAGQSLTFSVTQDATGSRTLAYGTEYKWPGGTAPTLTTAANAADVLSCFAVSTTVLYCSQVPNVK